MIVYGSSVSPYVRKILVICAEKGVEVENQVFGPGMPVSEDFAAASPFRKIPAIKDDDFLLADSTFAFACNSRNERAVAAHCNISFIRPGKLGDRLIATATEVSRSGRSGIYDIRVTVDGVVVAEMRGHSRTIGGAWITTDDTK